MSLTGAPPGSTERLWQRLALGVAGLIAAAVASLILGPRPGSVGVALDVSMMPAIQATLNGISATLLVAAVFEVSRGRVRSHRRLVMTALASSMLFLAAYALYHWYTPTPRRYLGPWPNLYILLLATHIPLAATVPGLALVTLSRGWRGQTDRHRRVARVTFAIWLYVSITGVAIYAMLR